MPRESIHRDDPEQTTFKAVVGWTRDQYAQLGIQVTDADLTLLDLLYGTEDQQEGIGAVLLWWLQDELPKFQQVYPDLSVAAEHKEACRSLGQSVLSWVEGQRGPQERDGLWVDLSRHQANVLVRLVRKARDAAYGKDA